MKANTNNCEKNGICLAKRRDIPECARIMKNIYNSNILSEGWTDKSAKALCEFYYNLQPDLFFVAKRNNKVIGFSYSYIKPWADGNHLMVEEISVDPRQRKFGTALMLIKQVFNVAINKYHITKIEGVTYEDKNGAPFKIYKRMGFKRIKDLFLIECNVSKIQPWL